MGSCFKGLVAMGFVANRVICGAFKSCAGLNTETADESADARGRGHIYTTVADGTQQYVVEECCNPLTIGYSNLR
jgi:hypothetical protein